MNIGKKTIIKISMKKFIISLSNKFNITILNQTQKDKIITLFFIIICILFILGVIGKNIHDTITPHTIGISKINIESTKNNLKDAGLSSKEALYWQ